MSKLHVAVLRGGPSSEYEVSLKTGATILKHIPQHHQGHDIFISKEGLWHRDGIERSPERALNGIDVVINGLHGEYGEDGKVQKILEAIGTPYTGSDALASSIGMNKVLSKKMFERFNIKSPYFTVVRRGEDLRKVRNHISTHFFPPVVVKPASAGSSVGVTVVRDFNDLDLALSNALKISDTAMVEEYIRGTEATVGVVDNFRDEDVYALLPVEIRQPAHLDFFDYEAKYGGQSQEIVPGNFTEAEKNELQRMAKEIHKKLGLRHYSRTDFMVHPNRGVYALEVNTLPGLTTESLMPKSLEAVGCTFPNFIDHLITLALEKK